MVGITAEFMMTADGGVGGAGGGAACGHTARPALEIFSAHPASDIHMCLCVC